MKTEKKKDYTVIIVLLLAALLRLIGFFQSVRYSQRLDDFGPLIYPAALAGYDWRDYISSLGSYYGYGFSWIYAPIFWIFKDGVQVIRVISYISSAVAILLSGYIYWLEKRFLKMKPGALSALLAVVASLYIGDTPYSWGKGEMWYHTDNELAVSVYVWIIVGLLLKLHELGEQLRQNAQVDIAARTRLVRERILYSGLLAVVLPWGSSIHERLTSTQIAVILSVAILIILRRIWIVQPIIFGAGFVGAYYGQRFIRKLIIGYLWMGKFPSHNTNAFRSFSLDFLTSWKHFKTVLLLALGNIHGFLTKGYGLAAIALVIPIFWGIVSIIQRLNKKWTIGKDLTGDEAIGKEMLLLLVFVMNVLAIIFGHSVRWGKNVYLGFKKMLPLDDIYQLKGISYDRYYYYALGPIFLAIVIYMIRHKDVIRRYIALAWIGFVGVESIFVAKVYTYLVQGRKDLSLVKRSWSFELIPDSHANLGIGIAIAGICLLIATLYVFEVNVGSVIRKNGLVVMLCFICLMTLSARVVNLKGRGLPSFKFKSTYSEVDAALDKLVDSGCEMPDRIYMKIREQRNRVDILMLNMDQNFFRGVPQEEEENVLLVCDMDNKVIPDLVARGYEMIECGAYDIFTNSEEYLSVLQEGAVDEPLAA